MEERGEERLSGRREQILSVGLLLTGFQDLYPKKPFDGTQQYNPDS